MTERLGSDNALTCVGRTLNLFLQVIRSLLNLSSGLNLAGWALMVGLPLGSTFCKTLENMSNKPGKNLLHTHLQRINPLAGRIKVVHQMHCGRTWDEERPRIDFYGLIDGWQKADDSTLSRFEDIQKKCRQIPYHKHLSYLEGFLASFE